MKGLIKLAIVLIPLWGIFGCAGVPLTEQQKEERQFAEAERQEMWLLYVRNCEANKGFILSVRAERRCDRRRMRQNKCLPSKHEWRAEWVHKDNGFTEMKVQSHVVSCVKELPQDLF